MSKKILFIEGTSDRSNGTLRQGFHKLIRHLLREYAQNNNGQW